jgi:hypothetical protein
MPRSKVIEHLRKEGEAHPEFADGPIAALKVYAESSDDDVANAARQALAALGQETTDAT